jgi:hypothetical protein
MDKADVTINPELVDKKPQFKTPDAKPNNPAYKEFEQKVEPKVVEKTIPKVEPKLIEKQKEKIQFNAEPDVEKAKPIASKPIEIIKEKPTPIAPKPIETIKEKPAPVVSKPIEIIKEKSIPAAYKPEPKAVIKESIIDKSIDEINQSEKRSPSERVPSYVKDASIKKEILNNTRTIGNQLKTTIDKTEISEEKPKSKPLKQAVSSAGLVYRVQLKASGTKAKDNDPIFSYGLEVEESPEDGMFKYLVGSFNSESEASAYKLQIKEKGVTDAFIVKYSNGKRVK